MKTNLFTHLFTAIISLIAFSTAGCAEKEKIAEASLQPAKVAMTSTAPAARSEPAILVQVAATASLDLAPAKWADIKDCTDEMRIPFFAGLKRLEARVDEQIGELVAKRSTMKGSTDTKDWDFAMKEMEDSRSYLRSMGEALSKATHETWDQEKDKVGQAWVRTQEAYAKVKSSTTN
ncbi:MAG: hypothetical protein WC378_02820 [Opitutaceae bacterium]|jgi:hypothetical protein